MAIFHNTLALDTPLRRTLSEFCHKISYGKMRMVELPTGEKV